MKAIIATAYGSADVLQLQDIPTPTPKDNEVLIKIHAAAVTAADTMMRIPTPAIGRLFLGLTKPKHPIPGTGLSGVIEAIGKDITDYKIGDEVFGESVATFGTYAEYLCIQPDVILPLPSALSYAEAAPICDGAVTSLNFLKNLGDIQPGHTVLINGASGSLGTAAVQLAKHFGATVTGVCSTGNLDLVKFLGADEVIDYTTTDFTQSANTYDIIYDTVGKSSFSQCKSALTENGCYLSPVLGLPLLFQMLRTSCIGTKKAKFSATGALPTPEVLALLRDVVNIIEAGELKTVMDKHYPLEQAAEAHRYVETGHKKGNIVLAIN